jgi:Ca-activated chloride channel family protein
MIDALWPHWQRPFWLLLLPLLSWLLWRLWHRQRRAGRWQALLPPALHGALLSGGTGRGLRLPWLALALGLAWLLAWLALLGPSWQRVEQLNAKPADPLVVVLELTPAMLANDIPPTRLEQAKRKLLDLLQARGDAQTAVVVFAGSAHALVPLSDDLATISNLLEALKPSIMPVPGRRADLAVIKALALLEQGAQGQGRLLLITSALDEQERQGIRRALGPGGERLRILGIGSREGAPVVQPDGSLLSDAQGAIILPRLDEAGLQGFATELGGAYQHARLDDSDLRRLGLLERAQGLREQGEPSRLQAWAEQGHWLLLALLLLAACAGRRGWLFCLPLLLMLPQPSYALDFDTFWLRPDQQGQRLLQAQRPAEAAERFEDPQWQAQALYQAGDYAGAGARFAQGDSAAAHYNRGNALAQDNQLDAALQAYAQALDLQPDLQAARHNQTLVEQLLRQQQQQAQQAAQPNSSDAAAEDPPKEGQQPADAHAGQSSSEPPSAATGGLSADRDQPDQPDQSTAAANDPQQSPAPNGSADNPPAQTDAEPRPEPLDTPPADAPSSAGGESASTEQRQALEQWLRQIPDDPGELLRRKFWYQQQQEQNR